MPLFNDVYKNRRVFLTGHTGFKGSWLLCVLKHLGATCCGFSLPQMVSEPNHFTLLNLACEDRRGDINDFTAVTRAVYDFQPELIFHLAAQPLVRLSYAKPLETFLTNVMGTVNCLEAARRCNAVRCVVVITTDKVYENRENSEGYDADGYREVDRLGGHDPYAASKSCAETVVASYRRSFYSHAGKLLASVRAGNVIGGGDWAENRLIPDLVKAAALNRSVPIRMPKAVRPWEHVLDPLFGYLRLGQLLLDGQKQFAEAWNFGPNTEGCVPVGTLVEQARLYWNRIKADFTDKIDPLLHETTLLHLNCDKAQSQLDWKPAWNFEESLRHTIEWYREYYENNNVMTLKQLDSYINMFSPVP